MLSSIIPRRTSIVRHHNFEKIFCRVTTLSFSSQQMIFKPIRGLPSLSSIRSFTRRRLLRRCFLSTSTSDSVSPFSVFSSSTSSSSSSYKFLVLLSVIPPLYASFFYGKSEADSSTPPLGSAASTSLLHDRLKNSINPLPRLIINRMVFRQSHYRDHTNGIWDHTSFLKIPLPSTNSLSSSIHEFLEGAGSYCVIKSPPSSRLQSSSRTLQDIEKELLQNNEVILNDKVSICIERTGIVGKDTYSVVIYQDNGFSVHDVDNIATAIKQVYKDYKDPNNDNLSSIFEPPKSMISRTDGSSSSSSSSNASPSNSMEQIKRFDGSDPLQGNDRDVQRTLDQIRSLGVSVYEDYKGEHPMTWDYLAGYDNIKREIKDTLVNALAHPEIYDEIAKQTRVNYESDACRPRAILFEGPPGTGKTLSARIIANQVQKPLVLVSVENILSKWYGESERNLSKVFDACDTLPDGAIIFIDEIDALATSRENSNMHEATRRVLSIVLQKIEGFSKKGKSVMICATNRKSDLDAALISRFDMSIKYDNPDFDTRRQIFKRYAQQLSENDISELSRESEGFSCRDIKDTCKQAERRFASKIVMNEKKRGENVTIDEYLKSVAQKKHSESFEGTKGGYI